MGHSERSTIRIILKFIEVFSTRSHNKYLGHSERSKTFMTTFKVVVKLVEVFTGNEKSQTIFEALRML